MQVAKVFQENRKRAFDRELYALKAIKDKGKHAAWPDLVDSDWDSRVLITALQVRPVSGGRQVCAESC